MDRYGYAWCGGRLCGDRRSPVQIRFALRGNGHAPIPVRLPEVASCVGMELAPVDLRDADSVRWLRALIWPEHRERAELLRRAVQIACQETPPLLAGDTLALLHCALDPGAPI